MSTRKFYTNLDLRFNELLNAKLPVLSSDTRDVPNGTIGLSQNGKIALVTSDGISEYVDGSSLALAIMDLAGQIEAVQGDAQAALVRGNHTGTQTADTISNFVSAAKAAAQELTLDQLAAAAADVDFGGNAITGVVMPDGEAAAGTDAANRAYVDAAVSAGTSSGADKLTTARDFSITGDVTAEAVSFDGTGSVVLQAVIADGSLAIAKTDGLQSALDSKVDASQVGVAGGIAPLGGDGLISAEYLPGFVDDVLEFVDLAALPATGEKEKIYVTLDNGNIYRWSGTAYVRINDAVSRSEEALQLSEAQNFSLTGVVTAAAVSFDGTGAVELQTSIADGALSFAKVNGLAAALGTKFARSGGELTGTASYAAGVEPTAAQDLTTKAYVDSAVADAVQQSALEAGDGLLIGDGLISVNHNDSLSTEEGILKVDYATLAGATNFTNSVEADVDGTVSHTVIFPETFLIDNGLQSPPQMRRLKVTIWDSNGYEVEGQVQVNGDGMFIEMSGAEEGEMFTVAVSI